MTTPELPINVEEDSPKSNFEAIRKRFNQTGGALKSANRKSSGVYDLRKMSPRSPSNSICSNDGDGPAIVPRRVGAIAPRRLAPARIPPSRRSPQLSSARRPPPLPAPATHKSSHSMHLPPTLTPKRKSQARANSDNFVPEKPELPKSAPTGGPPPLPNSLPPAITAKIRVPSPSPRSSPSINATSTLPRPRTQGPRTPPPFPGRKTMSQTLPRPGPENLAVVAEDVFLSQEELMSVPANQRLADYLLIFGVGNYRKPEDWQGGWDSVKSVFDLRFDPALHENARYPLEDWDDCPLTPNLYMFAFPQAIKLYPGEAGHEQDSFEKYYQDRRPKLRRFIVTKLDGGKQQGICLSFYEPWSKEQTRQLLKEQFLDDEPPVRCKDQEVRPRHPADDTTREIYERLNASLENQTEVIYGPKAICLLMQQPWWTLGEEFLKGLYRINKAGKSPIPLERYVTNFMHEVPVPILSTECIRWNMADKSFFITQTPNDRLPLLDLDCRALFRMLHVDCIITIFLCIITEQPLVVVSSYWSTLVSVIETLVSLLHPLKWQGVYMPVLPEALGDFLYAPVPFIAGVHRDFELDVPGEVVYLDIDRHEYRIMEELKLPSKERKKLEQALKSFADIFDPGVPLSAADFAFPCGSDQLPLAEEAHVHPVPIEAIESLTAEAPFYCKDHDTMRSMMLDANEFDTHAVRKSFVDLLASLFRNYRNYLTIPPKGTDLDNEDFEALFNNEAFIKSFGKEARPLISRILETQMWARFLEDRILLGCGEDLPAEDLANIELFDKVIESVKQSKKNKTVLTATQSVVATCQVAPTAHTCGLPQDESTYTFNDFPLSFDTSRFVKSVRQPRQNIAPPARTVSMPSTPLNSPPLNSPPLNSPPLNSPPLNSPPPPVPARVPMRVPHRTPGRIPPRVAPKTTPRISMHTPQGPKRMPPSPEKRTYKRGSLVPGASLEQAADKISMADKIANMSKALSFDAKHLHDLRTKQHDKGKRKGIWRLRNVPDESKQNQPAPLNHHTTPPRKPIRHNLKQLAQPCGTPQINPRHSRETSGQEGRVRVSSPMAAGAGEIAHVLKTLRKTKS